MEMLKVTKAKVATIAINSSSVSLRCTGIVKYRYGDE